MSCFNSRLNPINILEQEENSIGKVVNLRINKNKFMMFDVGARMHPSNGQHVETDNCYSSYT